MQEQITDKELAQDWGILKTPEEFNVKGFVKEFMNEATETPKELVFQSATDPDVSIRFSTGMEYEGDIYCRVECTDDERQNEILYDYSDDYETGSIKGIENFIKEEMQDGFYDKDLFESQWRDFELEEDVFDEPTDEQLEGAARESELRGLSIPEKSEQEIDFEKSSDFLESHNSTEKDSSILVDDQKDSTVLEKMQHDMVASGFIPFELRDGYMLNGEKPEDAYSKSEIDQLRCDFDPGFGKVMGIDTTRFATKTNGEEQSNLTVIRMEDKDIRKFIDPSEHKFDTSNIVPHSIRAYKEYGEQLEIGKTHFGVGNLVTFELKLKGDDIPYRSTFMIDDAGRFLTEFRFTDEHNIPMVNFKDSVNILDRTDVENFSHFKNFEGKEESYRASFLARVDEKMPEFYKSMNDKMETEISDRQKFMDVKVESYKDNQTILSNLLNRCELSREFQAGKLAGMEEKIESIVTEIKELSKDTTDEQKDVLESKYTELRFGVSDVRSILK